MLCPRVRRKEGFESGLFSRESGWSIDSCWRPPGSQGSSSSASTQACSWAPPLRMPERFLSHAPVSLSTCPGAYAGQAWLVVSSESHSQPDGCQRHTDERLGSAFACLAASSRVRTTAATISSAAWPFFHEQRKKSSDAPVMRSAIFTHRSPCTLGQRRSHRNIWLTPYTTAALSSQTHVGQRAQRKARRTAARHGC